ncbi:MAG: Uma2 family endonuclease [Polyangiaceae bacterium]
MNVTARQDVDSLLPMPEEPDISHIEIDDGAPVDSALAEKNMRLLTEPLYTSWSGPPLREDDPPGKKRDFWVSANVGLFAAVHEPPLVPDVFLSVDARAHSGMFKHKRHRTYFFWEVGKPPEVVIEIVSNRDGGELTRKRRGYARMRIAYYVVWDPLGTLGEPSLHSFELRGDLYIPKSDLWFPAAGIGLTLWQGQFEETEGTWLRWCLADGSLIPSGKERAESATECALAARAQAESAKERAASAKAQAEAAKEQAASAKAQAEAAKEQAASAKAQAEAAKEQAVSAEARAERLASRLRELGLSPDDD